MITLYESKSTFARYSVDISIITPTSTTPHLNLDYQACISSELRKPPNKLKPTLIFRFVLFYSWSRSSENNLGFSNNLDPNPLHEIVNLL